MTPLSTHPQDVVRAFLYARQSKARLDGSEASTETQLDSGQSLADARGYTVVGRFADVGRSGWDPNVVRTDFEKMMKAVRAREGDVIIVLELARLTRKGAFDAMTIDEELKKYGVRLISVLEPFIDTSSPVGQAIFALIAALVKQDSDIKSAKLASTKAAIGAVGGRHSSAPPYGMRGVRTAADKLVVTFLEPDPETGPIVRRAADLAMEGHTYGAIAKIFNAEGIAPPGMSEQRATAARQASLQKRRLDRSERPVVWRSQSVRQVLTHPAIGGFASERRNNANVVARDESGAPLAPHKGVLSGVEWLALQEVLSDRLKARRRPLNGIPSLLSGWRILACGECGGSMGKSDPMYMCANPIGHGGLAIQREILDDYVARRVWARLTSAEPDDPFVIAAALRFAHQKDTAGVEAERVETQAHLDHVRDSIRELQADRKAGLYRGAEELEVWRATLMQYRAYEDACTDKLADLSEQAVERVRVPSEWDLDPGEDPLGSRSLWASWDVYERREFLALFLRGVRVGKGRDEDKKIVPVERRVTLDWHPYEEDE